MKKNLFISSLASCLLLCFGSNTTAQVYTDATLLTLIGKAAPTSRFYHRIDTAQYSNMPAEVKRLFTQSAGMAVAFKTDSRAVYATWTTKSSSGMSNMGLIGQKGLNIYIKRDGKFQYAGTGVPTVNAASHSATLVENVAAGEKECLVYLPLYEEITSLRIGVTSGSTLLPIPNPFRGKVLVYGSSITQGASAARTGLAYPSIMARNTGIHFINLGLSGSAKMEPAVADMITAFNADAYILDCVPNANSSEIRDNTAPLVQKIRAKHPSSPIILIQSVVREMGNFNQTTRNNVQTQNTLFQTEYDKLVAAGLTGLTMIPATDLLGHDHEGSVDGTHPNDLGFERMVDVIQPIITPIINAAIDAGAAGDVTPDPEPEEYTVSTLAGNGTAGNVLGAGGNAQFKNVQCIALDNQGNIIAADRANHQIKKITPAGVVSLVAGSTPGYADGTAITAKFDSPYGLAVDAGNNIYVADFSNNRIRKIAASNGAVTTVAGNGTAGLVDGSASTAQFGGPIGLILDGNGDLIVSDYSKHAIRKITLATGAVSTIAGNGSSGYADGTGSAARFNSPVQGALDAEGNYLIPDRGNRCIRKVTPAGVVTTIAGTATQTGYVDGPALDAKFANSSPCNIAFDPEGNLLITDFGNQRIRKLDTSGNITTLAGNGTKALVNGPASQASFSGPYGIAVNSRGDIFVGEMEGFTVRKISKTSTSFSPVKARETSPVHIVSSNDGLQATFSAHGETYLSLSVFSITGVLLGVQQVSLPNQENATVFIPVKPGKGVYILRLQGSNYSESVKFTVE
jgi:sugar lactone lactonase YvrE